MEIDSDANSRASVPMKKSDSTNGGTPPVKAARQKDLPPPLPMGSGLLSGTPLGPSVGGNGPSEPQGVNIWLSFPLKGRENVTINFAHEVEKKYGFAALHPRIAARKERQRQITAAGAALEKAHGMGSADDMSVDLSENESNNDVTGIDDDGSAAGNGAKKRRKRKTEDYDKEDDFIDDAELAWEQQALMVKDGFFVYSGPLVTEEKVVIERYVLPRDYDFAPTYIFQGRWIHEAWSRSRSRRFHTRRGCWPRSWTWRRSWFAWWCNRPQTACNQGRPRVDGAGEA